MVKVLLVIASALRSAPLFELAGSAAIVAGVWLLAGIAWALIAFGALALVKSLDLSLEDAGKATP